VTENVTAYLKYTEVSKINEVLSFVKVYEGKNKLTNYQGDIL